MTDAEAVATIVDLIQSIVPDATIRVEFDGKTATVFTPQPGLVIGRRGVTAERIRLELADLFLRPIDLNVVEEGGNGGAGVREPTTPGDPPPAERMAAGNPLPWDPAEWDGAFDPGVAEEGQLRSPHG